MGPIIINLEPNYLYWQEILFTNSNGTLLKSVRVKYSFEYVKICSVIVLVFVALCYYDHDLMDGLLGALFFFVISLIYFLKNLRTQYLWRKEKFKYFEWIKTLERYDVILSSDNIKFQTDKGFWKFDWDSLEKLERTKRGLRLYTSEGYYIIPQKAMSEEEFQKLFSYAEKNINIINVADAS